MSRFVLDASVTLSWCFAGERSAVAQRALDRFKQGDTALAPSFWPHEILNALMAGERRKRISSDLIHTFLADISVLPVSLEQVPADVVFDRIQSLSHEHRLTSYDAAYLDLAKVHALPLATLDEALIRACQKDRIGLI